jgi:outer membrane protein assembly factor BamB
VRGREVRIADALEEELKAPRSEWHGMSGDSWPMFGGSPDRARIANASSRPGARLKQILYRTDAPSRELPANVNRDRRRFAEEMLRNAGEGFGVSIFPAVDAGELFFQDGAAIYAVSIESGLPLSGWMQSHPGRDGVYDSDVEPSPRMHPMTVTVTDRDVLAILGGDIRMRFMQGMAVPEQASTSKLVCLDRATGRERWAAAPSKFGEKHASLRELDLVGSPLVVGDSVFVAARGGKGQFEDVYVLCFRLSDGELRWVCYVASAGNIVMAMDETLALGETIPQLAFSGGRLFVQSNVGAVAAIDAYSGAVSWLRLYPRLPTIGVNMIRRAPRQTSFEPARPWTLSAPIVTEGKVFALPSDASNLIILDAGNGDEIKRIGRTELLNANTLLAVRGNKLLVAGSQRKEPRVVGTISYLDWTTYDARRFSRDDMLWYKVLSGPVQGRPFATADSVYVPLKEKLNRISLETGRVEEEFPAGAAKWQGDEGRGNVLVTQDHVVIATAVGVDIYTDLAIARAKLEREEAAAPRDPNPRLRHAEVMFAAGEFDLALQKLDEAIELLGGEGHLRSGEARNRLFLDALSFAQKLASTETAGTDSGRRAAEMFARARMAADTPVQQVQWRLALAKHLTQNAPAEALELYQQILLDPKMRPVAVSQGGTATVAAEQAAETAIADLIRHHGNSVYAVIEERATAELEAAADNPEQLIEVARRYPNANAAPRAMLAAAAAHEERQQYRAAAQVLRQAFFRNPPSAQKAEILEALARNDLRLPHRADAAVARLTQAARLRPGATLNRPLQLPDGRTLENLAYASAAEEVRRYVARVAEDRLPTFALPSHAENLQYRKEHKKQIRPFLPVESSDIVAGIDRLIVPPHLHARHDRVVAWSDASGLSIFAVGNNKPLATSRVTAAAPVMCAWSGDELLVWSQEEVALVTIEDNQIRTLWKTRLDDLPKIEVATLGTAEEESVEIVGAGERIRQRQIRRMVQAEPPPAPAGPETISIVSLLEDRIVAATNTGRVLALDHASGALIWQVRPTQARPARLATSDDFVALKATDHRGAHILVFDSFRGEMRFNRSFGVDPAQQPVNLAVSPDGTLVWTTPDAIYTRDLFDPSADRRPVLVRPAEAGRPFENMGLPEHLIINEGRIFAVSDGGRFVRLHSLEDGRPIRIPAQGREIDALLATNLPPGGGQVWLRPTGVRLYVITQSSLVAYHLAHGGDEWRRLTTSLQSDIGAATRGAFIGKDYVVLLDELSGNRLVNNRAAPTYRINAFSRELLPDEDRESGMHVHAFEVAEPTGITEMQGVEGGFYYLTGDGRLVHLRGARSEQ